MNHSTIFEWNTGEGPVVFITANNFAYRELELPGRQLQSKLLEDYRHFHLLVEALLAKQPQEALDELEQADKSLIETIEQKATWCKSTAEAFKQAEEALQVHSTLLNRLYDQSDGNPTFVPDTNALLFNPHLESWRFPQVASFSIGLVPSVLEELDSLKMNHRQESVRKKSESLIRQIKDYRRRGSLTAGVPIVSGTSSLFAVATEPKPQVPFPWLDLSNADDRFIASVVELMRSRPRSPVVAVTRDINLQNKAEFARVAFIEPPEPE
jgi:hypothetical protein